KKLKKILLVFLVLLILIVVGSGAFLFFAIYLPYKSIEAKGKLVVASSKKLTEDFKKNDIDLIQKRMDEIDKEYKDFETESKKMYWLSGVVYVRDYKNGVEAGRYMINAAQEAIKAIE